MFYTDVDIKAKERLYREIGELMMNQGFVADLPCWRHRSDETIASLFVENYHSSYLFYISLGVYVIGLNDKGTRRPKLRQMHAWTRLSQLTHVTHSNSNVALKGDGTDDANKTIDEVLSAIKTVAFKVLSELSSLEGTKQILDYYGDRRWQIKPVLKEKLYGNPQSEIRGELPLQEWEITGSVNPYHK